MQLTVGKFRKEEWWQSHPDAARCTHVWHHKGTRCAAVVIDGSTCGRHADEPEPYDALGVIRTR